MNGMFVSSRGVVRAMALGLALMPMAGFAQSGMCWQNAACWGDRLQVGVTTSADAEALLGAEQRRVERSSELSADNRPIHYESWYYSAAASAAPARRGMLGGLRQAASSALGVVSDVGATVGGETGNRITQQRTSAAFGVSRANQRVSGAERLADRAGLGEETGAVATGASSLRLSFRDGVLVSVAEGG